VAWLFRQVLNVIAKALGFATTTRVLPREVVEPEDPSLDPGRHADAGEFADPGQRCGRLNGSG
jgi:hypothetical protein